MIIDDLETPLLFVARKMAGEKISEIKHTIELLSGEKFFVHIKRLKK